jgi:hypothetical protein
MPPPARQDRPAAQPGTRHTVTGRVMMLFRDDLGVEAWVDEGRAVWVCSLADANRRRKLRVGVLVRITGRVRLDGVNVSIMDDCFVPAYLEEPRHGL